MRNLEQKKVQKFIDYASSFGLRIYRTASEISQEALQDIMRAVDGNLMRIYCR